MGVLPVKLNANFIFNIGSHPVIQKLVSSLHGKIGPYHLASREKVFQNSGPGPAWQRITKEDWLTVGTIGIRAKMKPTNVICVRERIV